MISKEQLLSNAKKKWKPIFLLAYSRFLTYEELEKTNYLEAYDNAVLSNIVKTPKDWNKLVIPYTEDNIKKALCIELNRAANDITHNIAITQYVYPSDIVTWLYILEDTDINTSISRQKTIDSIKSFYNEVSKKYKFDTNL